ncbi:TIM barrel protein [Acholeplasma granularum]|uniref:TIM barrel protein n=1 Tax=Acholeplasma granularum TaxID=264635 RepID=UPI00046F6046|nr:TIM barrel protein [Acholeplasma granularum]
MKPIISSFVDYDHASIDEQLKIIHDASINYAIIRRIDGKKFYQLDDDTLTLLKEKFQEIPIIAVDPLLESFDMKKIEEITYYNNLLESLAKKVSNLKSKYFIYTIPKFDETIKPYNKVIETVKKHLSIIKKEKLKVLIKFDDNHTPKMYRYILDNVPNKNVEIIFDYVYLYKLKEAEVTAYRILRHKIGMVIMDDIDRMLSGRILGSGDDIDVKGIAKRLIKMKYDGYIVLDSSIIELVHKPKGQSWFNKLVSKNKKHEYKIYEDYIQRYQNTDTYFMIRIQLAVLYLMFYNKKISIM